MKPIHRSVLYILPTLALLALIGSLSLAQQNLVYVLRLDGMIAPSSADFVGRGLARAAQRGARLVVLEMDTPGGLDTSMRAIIKDILASPVPVATFVAPDGARAASAGTYILYASHVAAMAPATNVGAASPVPLGGAPPFGGRGDDEKKEKDGRTKAERDIPGEKALNDAAAYLRSLAQMRGRNAEFAENAVRSAASLSAEDALAANVIDLIAKDTADLLRQLDGRELTVAGNKIKLELAGAGLEQLEPDWRSKLLAVLSNPTVAVMLLTIGIYGLFVEFTSPGYTVPGVGGAICLLLALYALHLLPVNWVGVGLLLLGAGLMIAEVFLPSFGVIGVGGIIAMIVGGLMVIDTESPDLGVPVTFVVALALTMAAAIAAVGAFALRARRRPVVSGKEDLVGAHGTIIDTNAQEAWAQVRGERWRVRANGVLSAGDPVRVTGIDGLTLDVVREQRSH